MRGAIAAAILVLGAVPAEAAAITYQFSRGGLAGYHTYIDVDAPTGGEIAPWSLNYSGPIGATSPIRVTVDNSIGQRETPSGSTGVTTFASLTGWTLDSGSLMVFPNLPLGSAPTLSMVFSPVPGQSTLTVSSRAGTDTFRGDYIAISYVPEPASLAMFPLGLAFVARLAWRRRLASRS